MEKLAPEDVQLFVNAQQAIPSLQTLVKHAEDELLRGEGALALARAFIYSKYALGPADRVTSDGTIVRGAAPSTTQE
jgi:hypothetical protein